jgi:hypothetical protein
MHPSPNRMLSSSEKVDDALLPSIFCEKVDGALLPSCSAALVDSS